MSDQQVPTDGSQSPTSPPPPFQTSRLIQEDLLACEACGRQDETVRAVVYPYVFSPLLWSFRREFSGCWCPRHRTPRLILAILITGIVGWTGGPGGTAPIGLFFTILTLIKLALGGEQSKVWNCRMLYNLAEHKVREGDAPGAIRCLEAALQIQENASIRQRLDELHEQYPQNGTTTIEEAPRAYPIILALLGATMVGLTTGILDFFLVLGIWSIVGVANATLLPEILGGLAWVPSLVVVAVSALAIHQLTRWALARIGCYRTSLGIGLAITSICAIVGGLLAGRALAIYGQANLPWSAVFEPTAILMFTQEIALTRSNILTAVQIARVDRLSEALEVLFLLVCTGYYAAMSIPAAIETARGTLRLLESRWRNKVLERQALGRSWLTLAATALGLATLITLLPHQAAADYVDAINYNWLGEGLLAENELDAAREALEEATRLGPTLSVAHENLGWTYYHLARPVNAALAFKEAIRLNPGLVTAHSGLGWLHVEAGATDQAIMEFRTAIRLDPNWADAHLGLGWAYYYQGDLDRAEKAFQEALRLDPNMGGAHEGLGWIYYYYGELDRATLEFRAAIRFNPDNAYACIGLGQTYYAEGDLEKATTQFQNAAEIDPDLPDAHTGLGWSYLHQNKLEEARQAFRKAIELDPYWDEAREGLGFACLYLDEYAAAIEQFTWAIELNPYSSSAHQGLGEVYYTQGALDEAIRPLQEAVSLDPQNMQAYLLLGWSHAERGEYRQAVTQYETLVALQPDWGAPHAFLAAAYYQMDRLDLVAQEIRAAQDLQGEDSYTYYALAAVHFDLRQFDQAEAALLKAIELSPDTVYQHVSLAYVYTAQGKFDLAFEACDTASELRENDVEILLARGDIHIAQENLGRAQTELVQALQIEPENSDVHNALSFVYLQQGQIDRALQEAEEAVRLGHYNASGYRNLAFARYAQGQTDQALSAAMRAVQLVPKYDLAHYILGLCYLERGEDEKARTEFEMFLALYWDRAYVQDYKAQAEAYLQQLSP